MIARERKRLRRKFIEKLSSRHPYMIDRWWDLEFARAAIPVAPGFLLEAVDGRSATSVWLLGMGACFAMVWIVFVFSQILAVYSRYADKRYMLIGRKRLAQEYQS